MTFNLFIFLCTSLFLGITHIWKCYFSSYSLPTWTFELLPPTSATLTPVTPALLLSPHKIPFYTFWGVIIPGSGTARLNGGQGRRARRRGEQTRISNRPRLITEPSRVMFSISRLLFSDFRRRGDGMADGLNTNAKTTVLRCGTCESITRVRCWNINWKIIIKPYAANHAVVRPMETP